MNLNTQELMQVSGGGYGIWGILAGLITFIISAVEGFINPLECNKWF